MEWSMPANDIFDEEVTKITSSLVPPNFSGDVRTTRAVQEQVAKLIDQLGQESATAQGLNKVITSTEKLRNNPAHVIYLLREARANNGKGDIIGMLKVGRKHLFLFDDKEQVHEVEPLCVLDFYVLRDRQRMGFGRMLYDYMLHDLEVKPCEMAIDGPSVKMEKFLARNFGIEKLMRQNNNFAVAPGFFDRSDEEISEVGGCHAAAVSAAVGRFAAPKPASAIANVIHGAGADDASRSKTSGTAATAGYVYDSYEAAIWDDDDPSEPELDDDAYEFDPDQPAAERRDEMRARGPYRYSPPVRYNPPARDSPPAPERPATLGVQPDAAPSAPEQAPADADVPAAGMPSGGHSAAGTPSGASGRRDSQLTERGYFDVKYYHNKLW